MHSFFIASCCFFAEIDIALSNIEYQTAPIVRGIVNNNIFNVTLKHVNGTDHVAGLSWDIHHNFNMTYAYHTAAVTSLAQFNSLAKLQGTFNGTAGKVRLYLFVLLSFLLQ